MTHQQLSDAATRVFVTALFICAALVVAVPVVALVLWVVRR